jgi:hypothetical protein
MENMSAEQLVQFLRESLPSVILALHDIASRRRREAKLALRALCARANAEPQLQDFLVSTTVACLAGASESIRAGVVEALGLYAYALEDCEDLKARFVGIVLLLGNPTPQMARSLVKFLRLTIQGVTNPEVIDNCFQFFLKTILGSSVARAACRVRIRTLIEKLGKKFGWDKLEKMIPEAHVKMFRYTRRMYNRRVRKSQERATRENESEDDMDSSDEEAETLCMYESVDPVDLASGKIPMIRKRLSTDRAAIKTNEEGKLVIEEDEEMDKETPTVQLQAKKRVSLSDLAELRDRASAFKKAQLAENVSLKTGHGKKKSEQVSKRSRRKHELIGLTQFAPKKASAFGDCKKATADTDPFAYVRLNPSLVREKYKGNALQALSKVIRKTGEKAGRKAGRSGVSGTLFVQKPSFKKQRRGRA